VLFATTVFAGIVTHIHGVKAGVNSIEVFAVKFILCDAQCLTETLEVHDFALTQEFDGLTYIGVFNQTQNVVVGGAGFLLCCTFVNTTYYGRR